MSGRTVERNQSAITHKNKARLTGGDRLPQMSVRAGSIQPNGEWVFVRQYRLALLKTCRALGGGVQPQHEPIAHWKCRLCPGFRLRSVHRRLS